MQMTSVVPPEEGALLSPPAEHSAEQVNGIISYSLNAQCRGAYDEWFEGIKKEMKEFDGFVEVDVVFSPVTVNGLIPVSVVLRFEKGDDLRSWETSAERATWLRCVIAPERKALSNCVVVLHTT